MDELIYKIVISLFLSIQTCEGGVYVLQVECTTYAECDQVERAVKEKLSNTISSVANNSNIFPQDKITVFTLQDFNECDNSLSFCSINANCENVFRTFSCQCLSGYRGVITSGSNVNCTDINECENSTLNNCGVNQTCLNYDGGYSCLCDLDGTNQSKSICSESTTILVPQSTNTTAPSISTTETVATTFNFTVTEASTERAETHSNTTMLVEQNVTSETTQTQSVQKTTQQNIINETEQMSTQQVAMESTPIVELQTTQEWDSITTHETVASTTQKSESVTTHETVASTTQESDSVTTHETVQVTTQETVASITQKSDPVTTHETVPSTTQEWDSVTVHETVASTTQESDPVTTQETVTSTTQESDPVTTHETVASTTQESDPVTTHETVASTTQESDPVTTHETVPSTTQEWDSDSTQKTRSSTTQEWDSVTTQETVQATTQETVASTTQKSDPVTTHETVASTTQENDPVTTHETVPSTTQESDPITTQEAVQVTTQETVSSTTPETRSLSTQELTTGLTYTSAESTTTFNIPGSISANFSNEDALVLVDEISKLFVGKSVNEETAIEVLGYFDSFASSNAVFDSYVTSQITQLVETLLNTMTLKDKFFQLSSSSLTVGAVDTDDNSTEALSFSISGGFDASSALLSTTSQASISLPVDLLGKFSNERISFTGYGDSRLFQSTGVASINDESINLSDWGEEEAINSAVIGSSINGSIVDDLATPISISLPTYVKTVPVVAKSNRTVVRRSIYNPRCVFFDYALNNGTGGWSREGCRTITSSSTSDVICQCNHLTSFAVLMSLETTVDDEVLNVLTFVGCSLSIIGLFISIITYSIFRQLRKHRSKQILLNFCVALFGVYVVYLLGIGVKLPSNQSQCIASGFFLHFFLIATFAWMLVEVLDMYLMFVKVWSAGENSVKKACVFAWGFPVLLSTVTLGANYALEQNYPEDSAMRLYPMFRETVVCFLSRLGMMWALIVPLAVMMLFNIIFFSIVLYHVTCKRASTRLTRMGSSTRHVKARQHVLNATAILLLSGPTWVIGFLINVDPIQDGVLRRVLGYIFVVLNAFQGLWIFLVFTVRPRAVRNAWKGLFCGRRGFDKGSKSGSLSWSRRATKTLSGSTIISRINRRKSSTSDMRRSSASAGVINGAFSEKNGSISARGLEAKNSLQDIYAVPKKYRYQKESASTSGDVSPEISEKALVKNDEKKKQTDRFAIQSPIVAECSSSIPSDRSSESS